MFPGISLVSFFVPHLSPNLSCPQFPMLPAPHISYTFTALTNLAPLAIKLHHASTSSIYVSLCYPDDICLYPSTGFITPPYTSLSLPPPLFIFTFFFVTSHGTNILFCYPHIETSPSQLASSCLPLPPDLISSQPCLRTSSCYPDIYLYHVSHLPPPILFFFLVTSYGTKLDSSPQLIFSHLHHPPLFSL